MTSPMRALVTVVEMWPVRFRTTGVTPSVLRLSKNAVQAVSRTARAAMSNPGNHQVCPDNVEDDGGTS